MTDRLSGARPIVQATERSGGGLASFILVNREAIIDGARVRTAEREATTLASTSSNGISIFLDQLGNALRAADARVGVENREIGNVARRHGCVRLGLGASIAQVVHEYGDVCQTLTELAWQQRVSISVCEFQMLNFCLDDAIAEAVTSYAREREGVVVAEGTQRLGMLVHELRNLLNVASLSFDRIRAGAVGVKSSTALMHARSLLGLQRLVDQSLAHVRAEAPVVRNEMISVSDLLAEVEHGASAQTQRRSIRFTVTTSDASMSISGDRQAIAGALVNMLQNAIKFTPEGGAVSLVTFGANGRVLFEIHDECGGLPADDAEELFAPYSQRSTDKSGVGLGLSISRNAALANGGDIHVRNLPGTGCVFTLDLPSIN